MDLVEDRGQLRHAYNNALEVFQSLRNTRAKGYDPERLFLIELTAVAMEALDCIDKNTKISFNCFNRVSKLALPDAQSKIVKLGYSLVVLLETLLADRCEVGSHNGATIAQPSGSHFEPAAHFEQEPSTSHSPAYIKEEDDEFDDTQAEAPFNGIEDTVKHECNAPVDSVDPPATAKEEPIENGDVKMEEPDNDFPELPKEEPIVDFYCPITGTARDVPFPLLMESDATKLEDAPCNVFFDQGEMDMLTPPFSLETEDKPSPSLQAPRLEMFNDSQLFESGNERGTRSFDYLALRQSARPQECSLCHRFVNKFYSTCALERFVRNQLFDAIRYRDTVHKARIEELRASGEIARFCLGHFPAGDHPKQLLSRKQRKTEPISLVRPRRPKIASEVADLIELALPQNNETMSNAALHAEEEKRRLEKASILEGKFAHCYLCGLASDHLLAIPMEKELRDLFIARIIKTTTADLKRMSALHARDKALFCESHLRPIDGYVPVGSAVPIARVDKPTADSAPKLMTSRVISSVDSEWSNARKYAYEACQSFQNLQNCDEDRMLICLSSMVFRTFDCLDPSTDRPLPDFDSVSSTFADAQIRIPLLKLGVSLAMLLKKLMSDRMPCGAVESPPEQADLQNVIKSEPVDESPQLFDMHESAIKQEPVNIKEEPLDDFELVKQEEPEPDIFCPATGSARPLNEMDFLNQWEMNQDYGKVPEEEETQNRKSSKYRSSIGSTSKNAIFAPTPQLTDRRRLCYLCKEKSDTLRKFPANSRPVVQEQWIERQNKSPEDGRRMLELYRSKIEKGADIRWCSAHFNSNSLGLPKDLRPRSIHSDRAKAVPELIQRPATRPTLQVRPLRPELQLERLQQRYVNGLAAAAMPKTDTVQTSRLSDVQRQGTPRVLHQKTTSEATVKRPIGQRLKCDLCEDPEYPMHLSPSHHLRAKSFLESLIPQTPEEQDKVNAMLCNLNKEAKICSRHFWKEPESAIVSPPQTQCEKPEKFDLVQSTLYLLQKKDQEKKTDTLANDAQQTPQASKKLPAKRKASDDLA